MCWQSLCPYVTYVACAVSKPWRSWQTYLTIHSSKSLWVDETLHRAAMTLLQARLDKTYSLCDAVSFVLMQHYGITEALTTDHHFEQEELVRLLGAIGGVLATTT